MNRSRYINLGEWVHFNTYAEYDGKDVEAKNMGTNEALCVWKLCT